MTKNDFLIELKEVFETFEKTPIESYVEILFNRVEHVTIAEFRVMKMRVFDECEYFPRLTKWVQLKNWVLDKRIKRPMTVELNLCDDCLGTGFIKVISRGTSTVAKCTCESSNNWQVSIPTLEQIDDYQVVPWENSEFRPNKECSFDNRVEWFKETINISEQFWKHSKFYKQKNNVTLSV
jgi:hypothetical protein